MVYGIALLFENTFLEFDPQEQGQYVLHRFNQLDETERELFIDVVLGYPIEDLLPDDETLGSLKTKGMVQWMNQSHWKVRTFGEICRLEPVGISLQILGKS